MGPFYNIKLGQFHCAFNYGVTIVQYGGLDVAPLQTADAVVVFVEQICTTVVETVKLPVIVELVSAYEKRAILIVFKITTFFIPFPHVLQITETEVPSVRIENHINHWIVRLIYCLT